MELIIYSNFQFFFQERLSHGISAGGFPGNHRTSDFQPPYFPPPFPSQQPTPQEVFAAQNAHLADPYTNSLHSFQQSQVSTQMIFGFYFQKKK